MMVYNKILPYVLLCTFLPTSTFSVSDSDCKDATPLRDPNDCHSYYICVRSKGSPWKAVHITCPSEGSWNDGAKSCESTECSTSSSCADYGNDQKKCLENDCQFSFSKKRCESTKLVCHDETVFSEYYGCRRKDAFYANGGLLCRNTLGNNKKCSPGSQRLAVNLAGPDYPFSPRMIFYVSEENKHYSDNRGVRDSAYYENGSCPRDTNNKFFTAVLANLWYKTGGKRGDCVSFLLPLDGDGKYELAIWTTDHGLGEGRNLNQDIELGDVKVIEGLNPTKMGGVLCGWKEIIILFEANTTLGRVTPLGLPSTEHTGKGIIFLNICYGNRPFGRTGYAINAYSLIKLRDPVRCPKHGVDATSCHKDLCQFDLTRSQCTAEMKDCKSSELYGEYLTCWRSKAVYANSGVLCRNWNQGSGCDKGKVLYAVNLNGKEYTFVSRNVTYQKETKEMYKDPNGVYGGAYHFYLDTYCPKDDFHDTLYKYTLNTKYSGRGCITYSFPLEGDGYYELSLWTIADIDLDRRADSGNQYDLDRRLNGNFQNLMGGDIKINNVPVVVALDPFQLSLEFCDKIEVIILFKVSSEGLAPLGFPPIPVTGNNFDLNLCSGSLYIKGHGWFSYAAFSLTKF